MNGSNLLYVYSSLYQVLQLFIYILFGVIFKKEKINRKRVREYDTVSEFSLFIDHAISRFTVHKMDK